MSETFVLKLLDGPLEGEWPTKAGVEWPLPHTITVDQFVDGAYVKERESRLPPQDPASPVRRSAQYRWRWGAMTVDHGANAWVGWSGQSTGTRGPRPPRRSYGGRRQ